MDITSREHEEILELCAASVSERLTRDEEQRLTAHLAVCDECRTKLSQYRAIEQFVLPAGGAVDVKDEELSVVSPGRQQKTLERLLEQFAPGQGHRSIREDSLRSQKEMSRKASRSLTPAFAVVLRCAAGILVAAAAFFMGYRLADQRARKSEMASRAASDETARVARDQVESLLVEYTNLSSTLRERSDDETKLTGKIHQQEREIQGLMNTKHELEASNEQKEIEKGKFDTERDALLNKLSRVEQGLAQLKEEQGAIQKERERESARAAALDARVAQLNELLNEREETISRQREYLAEDRDIRDLMGARDLYITEVHDVGRNGKTEKPFARVFYTKAQSLIFYAYDLDQQPGITTASTFQAWGVRDGDQRKPLSLGIFYSDNDGKKRWRLRFDDPKTVEELNAVFVTVEPKGGSKSPSGKQLLFAYLRVLPNHP